MLIRVIQLYCPKQYVKHSFTGLLMVKNHLLKIHRVIETPAINSGPMLHPPPPFPSKRRVLPFQYYKTHYSKTMLKLNQIIKIQDGVRDKLSSIVSVETCSCTRMAHWFDARLMLDHYNWQYYWLICSWVMIESMTTSKREKAGHKNVNIFQYAFNAVK